MKCDCGNCRGLELCRSSSSRQKGLFSFIPGYCAYVNQLSLKATVWMQKLVASGCETTIILHCVGSD